MATGRPVCDDEPHNRPKPQNQFGRFNPDTGRSGNLSPHFTLLAFCALTVTSMAQTVTPLPGERASVIQPLIEKVDASIETGRWLDAAQAFDQAWQLLDAQEDLLLAGGHVGPNVLGPGESRTHAGARSQLRSIAQSAPPAFHEAYSEQFDATARIRFRKAIQSGQRRQLTSLFRRYELTSSAQNILQLLTADARARGDSANLALLLKKIESQHHNPPPELKLELATAWLQAGFPSEAQQAICDLTQHAGFGTTLATGDQTWVLPATKEEIAVWTKQLAPSSVTTPQATWLNSQGNLAGYRPHVQQSPTLQGIWQRSLFETVAFPEFASVLKRLEQFAFSAFRNAPVGPAQPLVTDDRVIVQGAGTIQAIDRQSGQLIWESTRFNRQLKSALQTIVNSPQESQRFVVAAQIISEAPQNHVRGQMVSDGKLLFCVEETSQGMASPIVPTASTAGNQDFNILRVYDVATGRLLGQVGGLTGMPSNKSTRLLSAVYFLGAPLLLNDRILILAEDKQGIHLLDLRLNPGPGSESLNFELVDRQRLLVPKYELHVHPVRRFAGITPTFGDGLIICHGCDEHVLAVDANDLSLRWIHRYRSNVNAKELGNGHPVLGNAFSDADSRRRDRMQRAHDSTARIVGNQMILMPRDSDQVICLDVHTGTQLWNRPRDQLKYVAGFTNDSVVLAGPTELISLRRTDGKLIWQHVLDNISIAGQPAATDRLIYLPADDGQLIVLSLTTGRKLLQQQVSDSRPGNLISVDGQLLAQSNLSITSWTAAPTVETRPLASIQEALLREDIPSAIDGLTRLIESTSPEHKQPLRQMLADQLLESLRLDFQANRHLVAQLQTLIDESSLSVSQIADTLKQSLGMTLLDVLELPSHWAGIQGPRATQDRMEQLVIQGLVVQQNLEPEELIVQISGALRGALTQPQRDQRAGRVRRLSASHTAAVINTVLNRLEATTRTQVVQALRPLVQQILATTGDESLALHQAQFCWLAGLSQCLMREQVHDRLPGSIRAAFYHSFLASTATSIQPTAADLRSFWNSSSTDAPPNLLQLAAKEDGPFNDAAGRVADLQRIRQPRHKHLSPVVEIGDARSARALPDPTIGSVRKTIPLHGAPGNYRGWQFTRLQREPGILAIDSEGHRRWTFDYSSHETGSRRYGVSGGIQQPTYCVALGQLLALIEDGDLIMLDGDVENDAPPRIVWRVKLASVLPDPTNHQNKARAWERTAIYDRQPDGLAPLGPVTEFGIPLFRGHRLVILNPWSGAVMWFEEGLPDDCRMLAQGDQLVLLSVATGQVQVRNMRDGSVVRTGELPAWWEEANLNYDTSVRQIDLEKGTIVPWRVAVEGTRCLIFTLTPGNAAFLCYDLANPALEGPELVWQVQLPENSVFSNVSNGLVAILQNQNHLQIRQIFDGKIVVDQLVPPAESCERLYLRKSGNRLIVLTHCVSNYEAPFPVIGAVPVHGPIYAFDAGTGASAWNSTSNQQSIKTLNPDNAPMPASAPLLVLVKRNFSPVTPGNPIRSSFSTQILDVDDGSVLYEESDVGRTLSYHAMRFEEDGRITVSFEKRSVVFDFTTSESNP